MTKYLLPPKIIYFLFITQAGFNYYIAQVGLELMILLPQPSECWDCEGYSTFFSSFIPSSLCSLHTVDNFREHFIYFSQITLTPTQNHTDTLVVSVSLALDSIF